MIKYMVKPILTSFKMAIRARIQDQIHQIQQSYKNEIKYMVKPILTSFKMAIRARIQDQIHQIQQSYKNEMINPT